VELIQADRLDEAQILLERECRKDIPKALNAMGLLLCIRDNVFPLDKECVSYFERSAELGYDSAITTLLVSISLHLGFQELVCSPNSDYEVSRATAEKYAKLARKFNYEKYKGYIAYLHWLGCDVDMTNEEAFQALEQASPSLLPGIRYAIYRWHLRKAFENNEVDDSHLNNAISFLLNHHDYSPNEKEGERAAANWFLFGPESSKLVKAYLLPLNSHGWNEENFFFGGSL